MKSHSQAVDLVLKNVGRAASLHVRNTKFKQSDCSSKMVDLVTRNSETAVVKTENSRHDKTVARRLSEVPMTSVATQTVVDAGGSSQTDAVSTKEVAEPREPVRTTPKDCFIGCVH